MAPTRGRPKKRREMAQTWIDRETIMALAWAATFSINRRTSQEVRHEPDRGLQGDRRDVRAGPSFFKLVPDSSLRLEWDLFKRVQFEEGPIPNKYRELIGVAISAVTKRRYCAVYHTEVAKLNGATDAEIEDAVHYAKSSAGLTGTPPFLSRCICGTRSRCPSHRRRDNRSSP